MKCPSCGSETGKSTKKWKYGRFDVERYLCPECKLDFRTYKVEKETKFMLALKEGRYQKIG